MSAERGAGSTATPTGRAGRWRGALAPLLALGLVVCFWAVYFPQAERSVFGQVPLLDEVYYLDRAAAAPDPHEPYYMSPLYPRLIDLVGSAAGAGTRIFPPERLRGIRTLQLACWLGIVLLLRWLAGRCLAPLVPPGWRRALVTWLPPALFALYRPAAVYTMTVLLDVPLAFLVTSFLALLASGIAGPGAEAAAAAKPERADPRRDRWWRDAVRAVLLGAVAGLATLLRGTALLLLPLGMAAVALPPAPRVRRALLAILTAVAAAAVLAPAVAHNSRAAGRLVGPALNGGVNLYIGNGPEANGFYVAVVPGSWLLDPAGRAFLAERFDRPAISLAQADSLWTDAALAAMRAKPLRTTGLWLQKVRLHLQGWEIDQLTTVSGWTHAAPMLRVLVVPYALMVVLGLVGLAGAWRQPHGRWWGATLVLIVAVQSVFFVVSRYRLVLVPPLVLLSGAAVARGLQDGPPRGRRWWPWLIALLLVVPWGMGGVRRLWRAEEAANEALRWAQLGADRHDDKALARAEELYRAAVRGKAGGPAPWLGLAMVQHERGDPAGAEKTLLEGVRATTLNLDLHKQIIRLQLAQKRRDEAFTRVLQVLRDHPRDRDLLHLAAVLNEQAGRPDQALAAARDLRRWYPRDPQSYIDLGVLLARHGEPAEAAAVFREGLAVQPGHPELTANLAKALEDLRR